MYLVTSEQMQALDRHTISTQRVPGILLMEHAGKVVAEVVMRRNPRRVTVLCGKGNNGGDGWIAARWLRHYGVSEVNVVSMVHPNQLQGDAASAADMAVAVGIPFTVFHSGGIPQGDVYVDALLGTGASRPPQGALAELIAMVNRESAWTVSVDVPSGVDASTGRVEGMAIRANCTIAMACEKIGTAVTPGCLYAGNVEVADIGISVPAHTTELTAAEGPSDKSGSASSTFARYITEEWVKDIFPRRTLDAHKGTFGKVGVCVGEMRGAAILAGMGAARVGTGLVVLASVGNQGGSSAPQTAPYEFVLRDVAALDNPFMDCNTIIVGPGLGNGVERWKKIVEQYTGPVVLDADGLALAMQDADGVHESKSPDRVLTPHPKECARLLNWSTQQVQADRILAAKTLAETSRAVVVLKGYRTIVAHPDGRMLVNRTGNSALSTAGTGDVLAGMIGGFMARGLNGFDAAAAGVYLHGLAGEYAGQELSNSSVMATDVVGNISRAIRLHFDTEPEGWL